VDSIYGMTNIAVNIILSVFVLLVVLLNK
jgi:hypothetical protein